MDIAIQKSIEKWNIIRSSIIQMDCPLCVKYKTDTDCGGCPIKTDNKDCAKEYLDIHTAIQKFVELLEGKNGE